MASVVYGTFNEVEMFKEGTFRERLEMGGIKGESLCMELCDPFKT